MTHSILRVEVQGSCIFVGMRGTALKAKYRKQEAPWLATDGYGSEDPDAPIAFKEFRAMAWKAANDMARELGWIRSYEDLHEAAKLGTNAIAATDDAPLSGQPKIC